MESRLRRKVAWSLGRRMVVKIGRQQRKEGLSVFLAGFLQLTARRRDGRDATGRCCSADWLRDVGGEIAHAPERRGELQRCCNPGGEASPNSRVLASLKTQDEHHHDHAAKRGTKMSRKERVEGRVGRREKNHWLMTTQTTTATLGRVDAGRVRKGMSSRFVLDGGQQARAAASRARPGRLGSTLGLGF